MPNKKGKRLFSSAPPALVIGGVISGAALAGVGAGAAVVPGDILSTTGALAITGGDPGAGATGTSGATRGVEPGAGATGGGVTGAGEAGVDCGVERG